MEQFPNDDEIGLESSRPEEDSSRVRPRIYIVSSSDLDAGLLHGAWVDAGSGYQGILRGIADLLGSSLQPDAKVVSIFDYEGFGPLRIDQERLLPRIGLLGIGIAEHGVAFAHYAHIVGCDPDQLEDFEDAYIGHFKDLSEYAKTLYDFFRSYKATEGNFPGAVSRYLAINPLSFAIDMERDGVIGTSVGDDGIYLFDLSF